MTNVLKPLLAIALALAGASASAQDYPNRPIRIIVPYAPGGGTDLMTRKVGERMRVLLGQTIVVENVPGAAGNIGASQVVRAPADGYTILVTAAALAISPSMVKDMSFDPVKDLVPVAQLATVPLLVLVRPDSPLKTFADLLAQGKKPGGKLSFASFGNGTPPHLVGESIKLLGGIDMTHIPYKGSAAAMPDTLSGQVDVAILDAVSMTQHVLGGRLRALAITGAVRSPALPDVPTLSQSGIAFDTVGWHGMFAPAALPAPILERLNATVTKILAEPDVREFILKGGSLPVEPALTAAGWRKQFSDDVRSWREVVTKAGIKPN